MKHMISCRLSIVLKRTMSLLLLWTFLLLVFAGYSVTGCASPQSASSPGSLAEITDDYQSPTVAVVPKCTTVTYWRSVRSGAEEAGNKLGVKILWKGPASEMDVEEQKHILDKFIDDKVSAIVFSACDSDALIETARRAKAQGVAVVLIDSGINDDTIPVSYVATDNIEAGRQAGHKLAQLIGRKGKVGLIPIVRGVLCSDEREKGFKEAISCYPGITLGPVICSESIIEKGRDAAESMITGYPDLKGIFAINGAGGVGAAEAIRKRNCKGRVKLVAFDSMEQELDALKAGIIQALVIQDPVKIGFEGVKAAVDSMNGKPVNKNITTGVNIITTEEINQPLP